MEMASGEHVAFLTQDATPAHPGWLAALLEGFAAAEDVGAVFGPDDPHCCPSAFRTTILVYEGETPVGWCQYGTREELPRIDAGRNYRKVGPPGETQRLWRITCFFVDREHRGRGVAKFALGAALASIRRRGGGVVEAYPVVSAKMAAVPEWRWFGTPSMFRREGFREVAPLGASGVLMRKTVRPPRGSPSYRRPRMAGRGAVG